MGASGNVTFAQTALPNAQASSPSDGTVVSWRNRTLGGTYRLDYPKNLLRNGGRSR